jgi:hypothetical protein
MSHREHRSSACCHNESGLEGPPIVSSAKPSSTHQLEYGVDIEIVSPFQLKFLSRPAECLGKERKVESYITCTTNIITKLIISHELKTSILTKFVY